MKNMQFQSYVTHARASTLQLSYVFDPAEMFPSQALAVRTHVSISNCNAGAPAGAPVGVYGDLNLAVVHRLRIIFSNG